MSSHAPDKVEEPDLKEYALEATASHAEIADGTNDMLDAAQTRRLKWKLDLFVLPLISSVYFFAAMGRSDIANAETAGMKADLQLTPKQYANATTTFLVAYVVFQLPGTLLIRKIRAPVQFWGAMSLWGMFTALTVLVKNSGQLLALRFFVGAAEAFVQGGTFYISFWYEYHELATRGAVFFASSTLAGAFNGLVAYGITLDLNGAHDWPAWRWIMLVEGVLPIGFALVVLALLPASPEEVRFGFSPAEKAELVRRGLRAHNTEARLRPRRILGLLKTIHFWLFVLLYCPVLFCTSSQGNFLPAIIQGFGYTTVDAQLFTVIVYACGFVGTLFWARVADKTNARGLTLACCSVGAIVAYAMLVGLENRDARFAATCLLAFSLYPQVILVLSWAAMNFIGYTRRGSSLAIINMFSQLFAISGNQAYIDPPYYAKGNAAALGMSVLVAVVALVLRWYFGYLNTKKKEVQFSQAASELRPLSLEELGERHPDFFHTT